MLLDVYITQHDSDDFSASPELVNIVQKALDPEDVRPVGDRPSVHSSTPVTYQIQARLYISQTAENVMLLSVAQERLQKYVKILSRLVNQFDCQQYTQPYMWMVLAG